jgi:hypothetical protein
MPRLAIHPAPSPTLLVYFGFEVTEHSINRIEFHHPPSKHLKIISIASSIVHQTPGGAVSEKKMLLLLDDYGNGYVSKT